MFFGISTLAIQALAHRITCSQGECCYTINSRRAIGASIRYRFYWSIDKPDLTRLITTCRLLRDVIDTVPSSI